MPDPTDGPTAWQQPATERLRIGTAERDAATDALRQHVIEGRLEVDEYQHRFACVLEARTAGDLSAVLADLPPLGPATADVVPTRRQPSSTPTRSAVHWGLIGPWASVNAMMIFIWLASGAGYFWPIWVIGPWGLAILPAALRSRHGDPRAVELPSARTPTD